MSVHSQFLNRDAKAQPPFSRIRSALPYVLRLAAIFAALQVLLISRELFSPTRTGFGLTPGGRSVLLMTVIVSALMSCFLFCMAPDARASRHAFGKGVWRICARVAAPTLALYAPFLWVVTSGWVLFWPALPGFAFGIHVKSHGGHYFVIVSGLNTVLLLITIFVISTQFRFGPLLASVGALMIAIPTSFLAHWLLHG